MVTCCMICRHKNDDSYHRGRGGGKTVVIEVIISENDDNDGRPLIKVEIRIYKSWEAPGLWRQLRAWKRPKLRLRAFKKPKLRLQLRNLIKAQGAKLRKYFGFPFGKPAQKIGFP